MRLLVIGQRVFTKLLEHGGVELYATCGSVEPGGHIWTQMAVLVLPIANVSLTRHFLFELLHLDRVSKSEVLNKFVEIVVHAECLWHASTTQVIHEFEIRVRLASVDCFVYGANNIWRARIVIQHHRLVLWIGSKRNENVSTGHSCWRHPHIRAEIKVQSSNRIMPALGLSSTCASKQIRGADIGHLDGVRLPGLHGLEHHIGLRVQNDTYVGRIFLKADDLTLQLGTQLRPAVTTDHGLCNTVMSINQNLTARNVNISSNGHKRQDRMAHLNAVGFLIRSQAPKKSRVLCVGVHSRCLINILYIDSAYLSCLFGRHLRNALGKLIESITKTIDEIMVIQILGDDYVKHCHCQSSISTRPQLQVACRTSSKPIHPRINRDQLGTTLHNIN